MKIRCLSILLKLAQDCEYQFRYFVHESKWPNDSAADKYVPNNIDGNNRLSLPEIDEPISDYFYPVFYFLDLYLIQGDEDAKPPQNCRYLYRSA